MMHMFAACHWGKESKSQQQRTLSDFLQLLIILHVGGRLKIQVTIGLGWIELGREKRETSSVFAFVLWSSSAVAVHTTNAALVEEKKNTSFWSPGRGVNNSRYWRGGTQTRSGSSLWMKQGLARLGFDFSNE